MIRRSELPSIMDAGFDGATSSIPFVTIIIPTYNRAETLEMTIESLLRQTYPPDHYEIIVVDNNSTDTTRDVVERFKRCSSVEVQYLFESRQGVHYARNSALKLSRGEILYYTDDDMIADAHLLMQIVKPFALNSKVGTVTGKVLPVWEIAPPDWVLRFCNNELLSLRIDPSNSSSPLTTVEYTVVIKRFAGTRSSPREDTIRKILQASGSGTAKLA